MGSFRALDVNHPSIYWYTMKLSTQGIIKSPSDLKLVAFFFPPEPNYFSQLASAHLVLYDFKIKYKERYTNALNNGMRSGNGPLPSILKAIKKRVQ